MKKLLCAIVMGVVAPLHAAAQQAPSPDAQVGTMTLEDGVLMGAGAGAMAAHLENAQFILLGEEHGFADPPEIGKALAEAARPYGLRHHVVEVGPIATQWTVEILQNDGVDGLAAALDGRPLALPFLNMREDAELAKYFLDNRGDLWGIDQEFIGSSILHLERLEALAQNDAARSFVSELKEAERNAFATGAQGSMFMSAADDAAFGELETHFAGQEKALRIIEGLRASAAIYQAFGRGENFKSNSDRIDLIKTQFLEHYSDARGRAPRALFKMGWNHVGRGTTYLNTFDIGSLTEGVAAVNGLDVLRLLIVPLQGMQTQVRPSPDGFFNTVDYQSDEVTEILGAMNIVAEDIPFDGWAVIEFAPLRLALGQKGLNALSPKTKSMVLGFDYLITTRGAKAATPLAN